MKPKAARKIPKVKPKEHSKVALRLVGTPAVPPVVSPVVLTVGVDFAVTDTLVPTSASIVALSGLAAMAELTAVARLDIETEVSEDSAAVLCASVAWIV